MTFRSLAKVTLHNLFMKEYFISTLSYFYQQSILVRFLSENFTQVFVRKRAILNISKAHLLNYPVFVLLYQLLQQSNKRASPIKSFRKNKNRHKEDLNSQHMTGSAGKFGAASKVQATSILFPPVEVSRRAMNHGRKRSF